MEKRAKPYELKVYEALLYRKPFSEKEKKKYAKLKRGYEGELLFDEYLEQIPSNYILLKDYWLSHNNRYFQIDHALLVNNCFYLYDVKNFTGDFYYENDRLYHASDMEVDDPLKQLMRTESLLRQLLHLHRLQPPIKSAVVFTNPEFALFQAPRHAKILLPNQLNRYIKSFMNPLPLDPNFQKIANTLDHLKLDKSPFEQLPDYHLDQLKKGIPCRTCRRLGIQVDGKIVKCEYCGTKEQAKEAILRNTEDFKILFPQQKLTTKVIHDWCNLQWSKRRTQYILKNHFEQKGKSKGIYYV